MTAEQELAAMLKEALESLDVWGADETGYHMDSATQVLNDGAALLKRLGYPEPNYD